MNQPRPLLVRGGRVLDPGQGIDKVADLLIQEGEVRGIDSNISPPPGTRFIDASAFIVCPGLIDLHCHLREPGFEYKETIATGSRAAARGGFTTVCAMPNTNPAMDSRAVIDFVMRTGLEEAAVHVLPIGCVTKGSKGAELAEMGELFRAGVVGFSDDGSPVSDPHIMREALSYSLSFGLPIISHCEVAELSKYGSINEGWVSNRLGISGIPNAAEEIMVARDIALAEISGGRLHIAHASTAGSVKLVRQAKESGLQNITCEVTPHHLTLSEEAVLGYGHDGSPFTPLTPNAYDSNAKVAPPLRTRKDIEALIQALKDGTIDCIATDHAPHGQVEKQCTLEEASNGISGLETALGSLLSLVHGGDISLPLLIEKLTASPAHFLGRRLGTLKIGAPGDITIFDPDVTWVVDTDDFASKGKNTPLKGTSLKGKPVVTIVDGNIAYDARSTCGDERVK